MEPSTERLLILGLLCFSVALWALVWVSQILDHKHRRDRLPAAAGHPTPPPR